MEKLIVFSILLIIPVFTNSQINGIRIHPEFGISRPIGDFSSKNVFAKSGPQLNINISKMWGKFGIELHGSLASNGISYMNSLPNLHSGLNINRMELINKDKWKRFLFGIGPVYNLNISKKSRIDISSKIGFAKLDFPQYKQYLNVGSPFKLSYLLFETNNEAVKKKLNMMFLTTLRLNYKITDKIALSAGMDYQHARNVLHSFRYLNGGFRPNMTEAELLEALRKAPTVEEKRKCHFNSIGASLGISFNIGSKDKPKEEPKESEKMEPPIPNYPEDSANISVKEADSLTLVWLKETPNVTDANYNLWLYEIVDSTKNKDSLIYNTKIKKSTKHLLPNDVKLLLGKTYTWKVQAIDDPTLKPCPGDCFSPKATFKITNIFSFQFYHLLTENSGNHVDVKDKLVFGLPNNIETGGKVQAKILNDKQEIVLQIDSIGTNRNEKNYSSDIRGRVTIDLRRMEAGNYLLEVKNERNKTFYLRFKNVRKDEPKKD